MSDEARRPRTLIPPPAPFAAALVGGWWLDRYVLPLAWDSGAVSRPLGWLWLAIGLALFGWTLFTFHRHRTTFWPLAFAPLIWIMLRFGVIRYEEAHLEAKFGDAYRDYKTRVRRWL